MKVAGAVFGMLLTALAIIVMGLGYIFAFLIAIK